MHFIVRLIVSLFGGMEVIEDKPIPIIQTGIGDRVYKGGGVEGIPYWKVAYPDVYLSAKDTNRAADLKVQLDYAVETWTAEFITGSKSVEADYDAFLNELQKLGEEYLAIYQAAYAK